MRLLRICGAFALAAVAGAVWFSTSSGLPLASGRAVPPPVPLPSSSGPSQPPMRAHRPTAGTARSKRDAAKALGSSSVPAHSAPAPQTPASSAARPPGVSPAPDQAELEAALLTAAELPGSGYTTQQGASQAGLGSLQYCPALSAGQSGVSAQASRSFSGGNAGPDISEGLFQDTVSGAKQMVGAFTTVPRTCGRFSTVVGGLSLAVTVSAVSFPPIGDETAAVQVNVQIPVSQSGVTYQVTISGDVVAIRHAGTVIVVTNVGYPLDEGLTESVAATAYTKVAARW